MRWLILLLASSAAFAQGQGGLSIGDFLNQVKSQNLQARSLAESVRSAELRMREPEIIDHTEFYATYNIFDDKKQTSNPRMLGAETNGHWWRMGLRKQTTFGLGADLYFNSQRTNVHQSSPLFVEVPDYEESRAVLELRQALWRNGFGKTTRNEIAAKQAEIEAELADSRSQLRNLLFDAENVYWALVSFNQIVKLQEENVDRARETILDVEAHDHSTEPVNGQRQPRPPEDQACHLADHQDVQRRVIEFDPRQDLVHLDRADHAAEFPRRGGLALTRALDDFVIQGCQPPVDGCRAWRPDSVGLRDSLVDARNLRLYGLDHCLSWHLLGRQEEFADRLVEDALLYLIHGPAGPARKSDKPHHALCRRKPSPPSPDRVG